MKVGLRSDARSRSLTRAAALLAGCLVVVAATSGCGMMGPRSKTTALPAELRVGITPNFPPLAQKEDGNLKGVEVDFAQHLGQQLNLKMTLVELPWDQQIPALTSGKIDVIMSGMSITAARAEYVDFTVPYMTVGQMALVRKIEAPKRRDPAALDQPTSRVGALQNTTGEFYARRSLKQASVMGFATIEEGVAALRSNQIDFFLSDAPTIWQLTSRSAPQNADLAGLYRPLTVEYLAWAVRQDDDSLRRQLNAALLLWEQNGQLEDVLDTWIKTRRVTLQVR